MVNDSIPIEEPLQPHIRTIISLTPNTQYAIRTYANYMMTGYNADELLSIFSNLTTTRTLGGLLTVIVYNISDIHSTEKGSNSLQLFAYFILLTIPLVG